MCALRRPSAYDTAHFRAAELHQPLGEPDRDVDERWSHKPEALEEDDWNADGVDRRVDDVGLIRPAAARENAREVAPVAARTLDEPIGQAVHPPGPGGYPTLEVMGHADSACGELVEAGQAVPLGRPGLGLERRPPLRRVAVEREDVEASSLTHSETVVDCEVAQRLRVAGGGQLAVAANPVVVQLVGLPFGAGRDDQVGRDVDADRDEHRADGSGRVGDKLLVGELERLETVRREPARPGAVLPPPASQPAVDRRRSRIPPRRWPGRPSVHLPLEIALHHETACASASPRVRKM